MTPDAMLARRREIVDELAALNVRLARHGYAPVRLARQRRTYRAGGRSLPAVALAAIEAGACNALGVARRTGLTTRQAGVALAKLARVGDVVRIGHGAYALAETQRRAA